jgi:hypothetical protein
MADLLKFQVSFGKRDHARYRALIEAIEKVPQGFRNQLVKELMLEGFKNKEIIQRYIVLDEPQLPPQPSPTTKPKISRELSDLL